MHFCRRRRRRYVCTCTRTCGRDVRAFAAGTASAHTEEHVLIICTLQIYNTTIHTSVGAETQEGRALLSASLLAYAPICKAALSLSFFPPLVYKMIRKNSTWECNVCDFLHILWIIYYNRLFFSRNFHANIDRIETFFCCLQNDLKRCDLIYICCILLLRVLIAFFSNCFVILL
jgi:hypothetical protein